MKTTQEAQKTIDQIFDFLRDEYSKASSQKELAKKYSCTQQYIQQLLSDKSKIGGLSINYFFKMFPNAEINLEGRSLQGIQQANAIQNVNGDHSSGNQYVGDVHPGESECAACRHRLQDALMASDIDDASKVKVYRLIQGE